MPLLKNAVKSLAKSVLIPLRLTRAASATDAAIENEFFQSGMTTLTLSNEESLEESGLLMKGVNKTIIKEAKYKGVNFSARY